MRVNVTMIYIVLVNYNGMIHLQSCLNSIRNLSYCDYKVIIVDNDSTDGSLKWIRDNYPNYEIISEQKNRGFAGGCNIGIQYALRKGAEYTLLLNMDTIVDTALLSVLIQYSDNNTVVAPKIYMNDKCTIWYSGGRPDLTTGNVIQTMFASDDRDLSPKSVKFISGCCILIHRDIWNKIGFFNENYFMYYEDVDLCMRFKQAGIRMLYIPETHIQHSVGGSSGGEISCLSQYFVVRNRLYFTEQYYKEPENGGLTVLRTILLERAFFEGDINEKYAPYVKAGIADYLGKNMGMGKYGKHLLWDYYYIKDGFYEQEEDDYGAWYWAKKRKAEFAVVNPSKELKQFKVKFSLLNSNICSDNKAVILLDDIIIHRINLPYDFEEDILIQGEGEKRITVYMLGDIAPLVCSEAYVRELIFQMRNLKIIVITNVN